MSFSDCEEDKLINQVAQYPALYDASHSNYINSVIKDNIWKTIGKEINKSDVDCKKKWKSIRDSYMRFKKNAKLGTGSAATLKNTKQKRHQQLSFLSSVPQHRAGGSNVTESQEDLNHNNENVGLDKQEQDTVLSENPLRRCTDEEAEVAAAATEEVSEVEKPITSKKKKKTDDTFLKIWKQRDEERQKLYKNILKRKDDDDIDLFCRHIGEVLRNLPPYEKAKAKKHLGEVLSDYEIMAASRSSGRRTSSSLSCYDSSATSASSVLSRPDSAAEYFHLDEYSHNTTAAASPGPTEITRAPGCESGPVDYTSYVYSPTNTEVVPSGPTDLSVQGNQSGQEEEHNFADTLLHLL